MRESSSESEMEGEDEPAQGPLESLPPKRAFHRRSMKPIKRPRFIKPNIPSENPTSTPVLMRPEEVFEKTETEVHHKKIEVRLIGSLPLEKEESGGIVTAPEVADPGGFGIIHPQAKPHESSFHEEMKSDQLGEDSFITQEQLAANRIPEKGVL